MRRFAVSLALLGACSMFATRVLAEDCGYEQSASCHARVTVRICERPVCCRKQHCHHHCRSCEQPTREIPRGIAPPVGPVYESMAMARSMPMMPMMAMPVMMASYPVMPRAAVYEEAPRQARETTCASSHSELELLKERFDRLHTRVNTLQDSMETQTAILRKITDKLDDLDKRLTK